MSNAIDISDLIHPVLTELQKSAIAAAEAEPVSLTAEAAVQAARAITGLSDFGDDAFYPRLELWLSETAADEELTELGRASIFGMVVNYLRNRLMVEDMVRKNPEILDVRIERPIIVAGLPRSGTTHLQNFLSADPRLRELPMWEASAPVPGPGDAPTAADPNPRRTRAIQAWNEYDAIVPLTKNIHEMSPDYVSEDIELQSLDFGSYNLEWRVYAPGWRDYYYQLDHTPVYEYMKKVLKVLTFLRGPDRWVLKCPQHMEQLPALFRVFPDATVAVTHRDPVASIQSALVGVCYISRITRRRIDADKISSYWVDRYKRLLTTFVEDLDGVPPEQLVHVKFDQFMREPMDILQSIYNRAGLPLTRDLERLMEDFIEQNPKGKHGSIVYNLKRDFGLEAGEIRAQFRDYLERFPVREEVE